MNFPSGSRERTFSSQNWARIGQVPQKQVFQHHLARYCSQTPLGRIHSIFMASTWIVAWSFELNFLGVSRELAISPQKSGQNPTFAAKCGVWLLSREILLPAPDRTYSFAFLGPTVKRHAVDRTEFTCSVKKSPVSLKMAPESAKCRKKQHLAIVMQNKRSSPRCYAFIRHP